MRNPVLQSLQPGHSLGVVIDPPIGENERHYIVTGLGPGAVVVRLIDNAHVVISNSTDFVAPFAFFIGPKTFLPPALAKLARLLSDY